MAKGKRANGAGETSVEPEDDVSPALQPETIEPDPADVEVLTLAQEFGSQEGVVLRIYRQGKGGVRDLTLLDEIAPSEFAPMMLADEPYNGGTFRLHFRSPTGLVANKQLTVAPRRKALTGAAPEVAQLHETMQRGFSMLAEAMAKAIQPAAPVPQPTRRELIEEMAAIASLFRQSAAPQPAADPLSALKMVREFSEVAKSLVPAPAVVTDGGEINTTATLLNLADKYFSSLSKMKNEAETAHVAALPQPQPQPEQSREDGMQQLRAFAKMLCVRAAGGADVETYANLILDEVGDETARQFVESADWFEKLSEIAPEAKNYRAWFDELRQALIDMTTPDPEEKAAELTAPPAPGTIPGSGSGEIANADGKPQG